jgi:type VI secretion system protein ImpH
LAHSSYRSERDSSFLAWINVIQRRQIGLLYRAWSDSQAIVGVDRPNQPHPLADRLRALAGLELADSNHRDRIAPGFKMAFAAVLSRRVRSPQPLAAMLSYHFNTKVRVEEFVARWLDIPLDQRTRLGLQFNKLGEDAVAGDRVWDCSTRFRIFVGPLPLERYRQFLPQGSAYAELTDLVSLYAGVEYEWDLVPVMQASEVPYSWLGNEGLLLGWSSWLGVRYDTSDAGDLNLHMAPNFANRSGASH